MKAGKKIKDIIFVISAGKEYGLGHLMRCAVLARETQRQGMLIGFILKGNDSAYKILQKEVPDVEILVWNEQNIKSCKARLLVFDTRLNIDRECVLISKADSKLVLLDRLSPDIEAIDLYILPVAHAFIPFLMNDRVLAGPDYIILSEVFLNNVPNKINPEDRNTLLITLGGSDSFNITCRVMDACHKLKDVLCDKNIKVIIGPFNQQAKYIEEKAITYGMEVVYSPAQKLYCDYLLKSFLVIAGFGITIYEIAYLETPSLFITHHKQDLECAKKLESLGLGWVLGHGPELSVRDIENKCASILSQPNQLNKNPELSIDGKGASRVIEKFAQLM